MAVDQLTHLIEEASHLSIPELEELIEKMQDELREREWDKVWDETFKSEKSIRYQEEAYKRILERIARGEKGITLQELKERMQASEEHL
jgi:hypothetical protein